MEEAAEGSVVKEPVDLTFIFCSDGRNLAVIAALLSLAQLLCVV